jgi:hypothetical protein
MKQFLNFILCLPIGILMSGPFAIAGTILGLIIGFLIGYFSH